MLRCTFSIGVLFKTPKPEIVALSSFLFFIRTPSLYLSAECQKTLGVISEKNCYGPTDRLVEEGGQASDLVIILKGSIILKRKWDHFWQRPILLLGIT